MIAKVLTTYQTVSDILDAVFAQTKKECEISSETIADNYEAYAKNDGDIRDDIAVMVGIG